MKLPSLLFCFSTISLPFHIFATSEKSPESNVRQLVTEAVAAADPAAAAANPEDTKPPAAAAETQLLSPELEEFKREFLRALEIPEAVQVLYSLFEFLSTPIYLAAPTVAAAAEAENNAEAEKSNTEEAGGEQPAKQCQEEAAAAAGAALCDKTETAADRKLSGKAEDDKEVQTAATMRGSTAAASHYEASPSNTVSHIEFVNSILSMDDQIQQEQETDQAAAAGAVGSVVSRIRRLQALKEIRRRTGEIVGNIVYGPQPALAKLFTPKRGPAETILFGRGGRRSIF